MNGNGIQTTSVIIQSLCVPCCNRCRYCLLSWDGSVAGAGWRRSVDVAERYLREIEEQLPDVRRSFAFGYSMEHPALREALSTIRRLGGPTARFLQCDGMKMRGDAECAELMTLLRDEGMEKLSFTVYGLSGYHDAFARRKGDFELLLRMMRAAKKADLPFGARIPLFSENICQIDELTGVLRSAGCEEIRLFVPHGEGRGKDLDGIRLGAQDLLKLPPETRALLNGSVYRTEEEWLEQPGLVKESKRMILISLRRDNIDAYESKSAVTAVREIEELDERYYAAFPGFGRLAELYGDPRGEKLYSARDLFAHYRGLWAKEHETLVYDVTDERQSGSRRY